MVPCIIMLTIAYITFTSHQTVIKTKSGNTILDLSKLCDSFNYVLLFRKKLLQLVYMNGMSRAYFTIQKSLPKHSLCM